MIYSEAIPLHFTIYSHFPSWLKGQSWTPKERVILSRYGETMFVEMI